MSGEEATEGLCAAILGKPPLSLSFVALAMGVVSY